MGLGPWAGGATGHAAEETKGEVRDFVIDQGLPEAQPDEPGAGPVTVHADLAYYDGPDFDEKKHRLDLYLPARAEGFPVLLFIHGGAWRNGDRKPYRYLGRALAQKGVGVAVTSYRLSPQVQHPAHIEDVARAFAWVHAHVAEYGGDPTHLFVAGHSAGGHLAALLATNEQFLAAHNLSVHDIAGVLPISGIYDFDLLRLLARPLMQPVLGDDPAKWNEAAPVKHVRADLPPFRIFYGDGDSPASTVRPRPWAQPCEE
jgi:acetyl esterase/lipase